MLIIIQNLKNIIQLTYLIIKAIENSMSEWALEENLPIEIG